MALVAGLAACTAAGPEAAGGTPPPSATATGTASPTPAVDPAADPTVDPAVTAAWAAEAVPTGGADGFVMAQSGAFQAGAPGSFTLTASTLAAGSYSVYLACRGDADTTLTLTIDNAEPATLAGGCVGESQGMDLSLPADGATFTLLGDSDQPVEWALAVTDRLPRAEG
ncbi:hypothetical protein E3T61_04420 [Cryobacterium lactosi]|uniref:Uncharacterized protein n=1 Tax=Cryobacterium lactosi TaxID=1259202 RepID=A0A4R9BZE2_9MICO|nr:hypothetical protein E3T61_04420 [Cryobacterium lactosi]